MKKTMFVALAALGAAGCVEDADPTASGVARGLLPCVFDRGARLEVGETRTFTGAGAGVLCLDAGGERAEYTLVPYAAVGDGEQRLAVEAVGANLEAVTGPPNPTRLPAVPGPDPEMHLRLRARMNQVLAAGFGPAAAGAGGTAARRAAAVPAEGGFIEVNVPRFYLPANPCTSGTPRRMRVGAVSRRAILVNDPLNPAGALTDAQLRAFGEEFDRQIFPVDVRHFGEPTDLDANGGRVIIVFTREVNALSEPGSGGYVGGFFFTGDVLPRQATARLPGCPRGNAGEIFYLLTPDPGGAVGGNRFPLEQVLGSGLGTVAHELQHLINVSRRLHVNGAEELEEPWLEEGLSHIAEELNFYEATGLRPRQNIGLEQLRGTAVGTAVDRYLLQNLARYMTYLQAPDTNSVLGPDLLETRGAAWAFLRYAADRRGGSNESFFLDLVNTRDVGVENLSRVIGAPAVDWAQDWTLAVYTDDAVPVEPRFTQPSWNFRSVMPRVSQIYGGPDQFPLRVSPLASAEARSYPLRGGGATYFRFGIAAGTRVGLRLTSNGAPPPESLRFSLVRTR